MLYRMRPMQMSLEFEHQVYTLGDTIDVTVEIRPRGNIQVRGGKIDLICEEKYIQRGVSFVPDTYAGMHPSGRTSQVAFGRKERFTHSSVRFIGATRLRGGAPTIRRVVLAVDTTPPPHLEEARALERDANSSWTFDWTLVASVDVVRGRNSQVERAVTLILPR